MVLAKHSVKITKESRVPEMHLEDNLTEINYSLSLVFKCQMEFSFGCF